MSIIPKTPNNIIEASKYLFRFLKNGVSYLQKHHKRDESCLQPNKVQRQKLCVSPFRQISQRDLVALQKTKQMVISSPIAFCGVFSSAGTGICHFSAKEFELSGENFFWAIE